MTYFLKKPTRMQDASGGAASDRSFEMTTAASETEAPGPDPATMERVKNAFVAVFGRLEALLGERWTGACDRLREKFPINWTETEAAEQAIDSLSVGYINGRTSEQSFQAALDRYERAWASAASALATADRLAERRCSECGRDDMTAVVFDDQGRPFCRMCLKTRS